MASDTIISRAKNGRAAPPEGPARKPFGVNLADPSRLFAALAAGLAPLRYAARLIWPLALLAGFAAWNEWYVLQAHSERIFLSLGFAQNLLIGMVTANLFSKISQGVVMSHFGIAPRAFGIRLLYGVIPRFYINKAPIRHLDFRAQRVCYAAPLLTKLAMFGAGTLMWSVLYKSGTGAAAFALAIGVVGIGSFLFTLNPLWMADGYRWFAAVLKRPDLREQSFRFLGLILRFKRLPPEMSGREGWLLLAFAVLSIGFTAFLIVMVLSTIAFALERQLQGTGVVIFGIILALVTMFLLSRKAGKRGEKRNGAAPRQNRSQPQAAALYRQSSDTLYLDHSDVKKPAFDPGPRGRRGRGPGQRRQQPGPTDARAEPSAAKPEVRTVTLDDILQPVDADARLGCASGAVPTGQVEDAAPSDDNEVGGRALTTARVAAVAVPVGSALAPREAQPPPAPRASDRLDKVLNVGPPSRRSRWKKWLIWAAIIGVLAWVAVQPYAYEVGGEFVIQPVERAQVRARTDGEIVQVNVKEGDWVETGQVMAVLSNWDEKRDIAVRKAEIAKLEADLETLVAGPKAEEIAVAQQAVDAAEIQVEIAAATLERNQQLFDRGTVSRTALDEARNAHRAAQAEVERAKAALALVQAPVSQSEIAAARAAIERNLEDLSFAELQLEHTNIRAVSDGQVVGALSEVPVGTFLPEGGLFAGLEDNRSVVAEIEVPETEIDAVEPGAPVEVKLWSAPDQSIAGTVQRLAPKAEEREFGRVIRVLVDVPNPDGKLAANMTGHAKIAAGEMPVWKVFTRVFERFVLIELWSWLP